MNRGHGDGGEDVLAGFLPPVADWFRRSLGRPTPPQRMGWPLIAAGRNTLIVAPTGSGKTLAAFLAAMDHLWSHPRQTAGVRILYISPLKALNEDIQRNLDRPLTGILERAEVLGTPLAPLRVSVRSGDTPARERQRMVRKPPDILITTPESLHILLTSRAREMLRGVSHVIVDEIHALCGNKRGVFLALLMERLEALGEQSFVRVGLSATQRPLDVVARYLGGRRSVEQPPGELRFEERPVSIVDAGSRKDLDLEVCWPGGPTGRPARTAGSVWPAIETRLLELANDHRSMIVFTNNRRAVETLAQRLNEAAAAIDAETPAVEHPAKQDGADQQPNYQDPGKPAGDAGSARPPSDAPKMSNGTDEVGSARPPSDAPKMSNGTDEVGSTEGACGTNLDTWMEGNGMAPPPRFLPHHGSLSLEERHSTEEALKRGRVRGVISTATLEMGIDMGEVDLVCQVESPGSVTRGLQRVGRAGHAVGGVSKGRLIAKTAADLLESAALARSMLAGEIEELRVPQGCLDVLAQQVVACVAVESWEVSALYRLVRQADPFRDLPAEAFDRVLRMISGRYPTGTVRDLRARITWDRVHNRLAALPGTAWLALVGGGTIVDSGQYPVYLGDDGPRLGELDEEFVFERRVGDAFSLGTSTWRIEAIDPHRVVVRRAEGEVSVLPFWRGEGAGRSPELGAAVGRLCREIASRREDPQLPGWLTRECRLEPAACRTLIRFIERQLRVAGVVPDDHTILLETFRDPSGELALAVLTPFGSKLHLGLKLALAGRIRRLYGLQPSCLHADTGLLLRLPDMAEPPLDLLDGLRAEEAEELIRLELPETAHFGLRFRQNAARALLMPRPDPSKRTPLWLQRLRAKDLLQIVSQFPDFPIVVETFRECLNDDLDLPRLRELLDRIANGSIVVRTRSAETPSPFSADLVFRFAPAYMYQWDEPRRGDLRPGGPIVDEELLDALMEGVKGGQGLDPRAVRRYQSRLNRSENVARSPDEMAERLRQAGDLTTSELFGSMERLLEELEHQGRAVRFAFPSREGPGGWIWIGAEESELYGRAFPSAGEPDKTAQASIVRRYLQTHALVGLAELTARYPIAPEVATELLEAWEETGQVIRLQGGAEGSSERWSDREHLKELRRLTLAIRRREAVAVAPEVFADFLLRRQLLHPATRQNGLEGLRMVLSRLEGFATSAASWERELLARRLESFRGDWIDELLARGEWSWRAAGSDLDSALVGFFGRDFSGAIPKSDAAEISSDARLVVEQLGRDGASFATDLARRAGLEPSRLRLALRELLLLGRVSNDRFDPLRPGAFDALENLRAAQAAGSRTAIHPRIRRRATARPEGRWSLTAASNASEENVAWSWIAALSERYGVLSRDLFGLEPWAPPWPQIAPWLERAELRGVLRRGYFVEGLSGVQYATDEAAAELSRLADGFRTSSADALVLVAAADPANLYGNGAPFDIPLLEGGTARLSRAPGNFLVLRDGRPILIIEGRGKRLTGLASASEAEIKAALSRLLELVRDDRRILKVETYNGQPTLSSPIATHLAELGFVRDHPAMTYYPTWPETQLGRVGQP